MFLIPIHFCSQNWTVGCKIQMAAEVKQPETKSLREGLKEKEERELALLMELAKIYYDGP